MTIMLALMPVPFQGKENITVLEHVKFVGLFRVFRRTLGQRFFVGAREAGLFVGYIELVLKSSAPSTYYHQVPVELVLALGEPVVPWCIWVPSLKLSEFLQTTYRKVVEWFLRPVLAFWIVEPFDEVEDSLVVVSAALD